MLTESGAFPMFHRVSVEFSWRTGSESMYLSGRDAMLESLKENKFPRLMKNKAVELDFSAHFLGGYGVELDRVWYN